METSECHQNASLLTAQSAGFFVLLGAGKLYLAEGERVTLVVSLTVGNFCSGLELDNQRGAADQE